MTLAQPARPQRRRQEDAAAARLERLAGLARALGSVAAVDAAADLVVQAARTSLPGVTAALAIVEDQQLRLLAATGYPRGLSAATRAAMVAPGTPLESAATEGAFQAHATSVLGPELRRLGWGSAGARREIELVPDAPAGDAVKFGNLPPMRVSVSRLCSQPVSQVSRQACS